MLRARRFSEDDAERQGAQRVAHFASVALGPAPADLVQEKRPKRQPTLVRRQQPLRVIFSSGMDHQVGRASPALRFDLRKSLVTVFLQLPGEGLEPTRISPPDPKSGASANSAIRARASIFCNSRRDQFEISTSPRIASRYSSCDICGAGAPHK
jgi:hypothetical protein